MIGNEQIVCLSEKYGTPLYVYDLDALKNRMNKIRNLLSGISEVVFSIKANPFLVKEMEQYCDHLEVCSPGEMKLCMAHGISPEKILLSGVNKREEDVREAMEYGVTLFTAESLKHVDLIQKEAEREGKKVSVLLRLSHGTQFGMSEEDIFSVLGSYHRNIEVKGIHFFTGTQKKRMDVIRKELHLCSELYDEIWNEFHLKLDMLEYGPGLCVPLFDGDDFSDTLSPLEEILENLQQMSHKTSLSIEMGRFFAAECGLYVTAVDDVKKADGTLYCIVDGGINHLNYPGQMMGMKVPVVRHIAKYGGENKEKCLKDYCVAGSLCTVNDILIRKKSFPSLKEGDLLVFENTGAYTASEAMQVFLLRQMPAVVFMKDGVDTLVRKGIETYPLYMGEEK